MNIISAARRAWLLTVCVASTGAWANSYTIVDLGLHKEPWQVNASGDVASSYRHGAKKGRPLVLRNGLWHRLAPFGGLSGIEADGRVGGATYSRDAGLTPYTWDVDGTPHGFMLPGGATEGAVSSLSSGHVIGTYYPSVGPYRCFAGDASGGETSDLGTMSGTNSCSAQSINASGQVAGSAQPPGSDYQVAFLWSGGTFTNLGMPPGALGASAVSINDQGHVVGDSLDAHDEWQAFIWQDGVMTALGTSPDFYESLVTSINNLDEAVGLAYSDHRRRAYAVRFENGGIVNLNKEVIDLGGWNLHEATSVNDAGVIVGLGTLQGHGHGFMLIPQ